MMLYKSTRSLLTSPRTLDPPVTGTHRRQAARVFRKEGGEGLTDVLRADGPPDVTHSLQTMLPQCRLIGRSAHLWNARCRAG
jgi:hypothetical protein